MVSHHRNSWETLSMTDVCGQDVAGRHPLGYLWCDSLSEEAGRTESCSLLPVPRGTSTCYPVNNLQSWEPAGSLTGWGHILPCENSHEMSEKDAIHPHLAVVACKPWPGSISHASLGGHQVCLDGDSSSVLHTRLSSWFLFNWGTRGTRVYGIGLEKKRYVSFHLNFKVLWRDAGWKSFVKLERHLLGRGLGTKRNSLGGEWRYWHNCTVSGAWWQDRQVDTPGRWCPHCSSSVPGYCLYFLCVE